MVYCVSLGGLVVDRGFTDQTDVLAPGALDWIAVPTIILFQGSFDNVDGVDAWLFLYFVVAGGLL